LSAVLSFSPLLVFPLKKAHRRCCVLWPTTTAGNKASPNPAFAGRQALRNGEEQLTALTFQSVLLNAEWLSYDDERFITDTRNISR